MEWANARMHAGHKTAVVNENRIWFQRRGETILYMYICMMHNRTAGQSFLGKCQINQTQQATDGVCMCACIKNLSCIKRYVVFCKGRKGKE